MLAGRSCGGRNKPSLDRSQMPVAAARMDSGRCEAFALAALVLEVLESYDEAAKFLAATAQRHPDSAGPRKCRRMFGDSPPVEP